MKKTLFILASIAILFFISPSCEQDVGGTCKSCKIVTYDSKGSIIDESSPEELCGDELTKNEGSEVSVGGDRTAKWQCN